MTATSWHSRAGAAIVGGVYNEIVAYLTPIIVKKSDLQDVLDLKKLCTPLEYQPLVVFKKSITGTQCFYLS